MLVVASVNAFVAGVSAAATGAIAGAAILAVTLALLTWVKKIREPLVILAAGLVGLALKGAGR